MGSERYINEFNLTLHEDVIDEPLNWKKPKTIFVNSMSDLFHERIPLEFIQKVFNVMVKAEWHTFQILTKRSERLEELSRFLPWSKNIWMGVSIENQKYTYRINNLRRVPSAVRFLSVEPLIGKITKLDLRGIDWVIVGGESGPKARFMDPDWVRLIRDKCNEQEVSFFFKQWGGVNKKRTGRLLDRKTWNEMPSARLRISSKELKKTISLSANL
jgi:protein gp37